MDLSVPPPLSPPYRAKARPTSATTPPTAWWTAPVGAAALPDLLELAVPLLVPLPLEDDEWDPDDEVPLPLAVPVPVPVPVGRAEVKLVVMVLPALLVVVATMRVLVGSGAVAAVPPAVGRRLATCDVRAAKLDPISAGMAELSQAGAVGASSAWYRRFVASPVVPAAAAADVMRGAIWDMMDDGR